MKPNCEACQHYQACLMWTKKPLVDSVFWCQIWEKEHGAQEQVETGDVDIYKLEAVPDCRLPRDFSKSVMMLRRPYYPLTGEQVLHIESMADEGDTDILKDECGNQYTWGYADGCTQLMPIQEQYKFK